MFNAITVIGNRSCGDHLDIRSPAKQYDLLVNMGSDEVEFKMREIGATFKQTSGTVIAFSGKIFVHSVNWEGGDRVGYAFFMREEIQAHFGAPDVQWPTRIHPA